MSFEDYCADGFMLNLIPRFLELRVLIIENIKSKAIQLGNFEIKENNSVLLRDDEINENQMNSIHFKKYKLFPQGYLLPKEKILIPLEIVFRHHDETLQESCIKERNNILNRYNKIKKINTSKSISLTNSSDGTVLNNINLESLKLSDQHSLKIEKYTDEYIYGPSVFLNKVQVDNIMYNIRQYSSKYVVIYSGYPIGSCPYIFTYSQNTHTWVSEGHILYGRNKKEKEGIDKIELKRFDGRLKIIENDPELSFIDYLHIVIERGDEEIILLPTNNKLKSDDNNYLILKENDEIIVSYNRRNILDSDKIFLRAKGFYLPDSQKVTAWKKAIKGL
ncbi:hypothetical protein VU13_02340 [Desulfobulbus sp. US5]|nr:hypothetical protein [Desulfobulbus sp. US5]